MLTPVRRKNGRSLVSRARSTEQLWDHSVVIALFDADIDIASALAQASAAVGLDAVPDFRVEEVPEQNWVHLTQAQFDPIQIQRTLVDSTLLACRSGPAGDQYRDGSGHGFWHRFASHDALVPAMAMPGRRV